MFQNLRVNHQIYILHKDTTPTLEIGKVTNIPIPQYMYNNTVDIQADVNGTPTTFQKIPANSEIADFGNNTVIASSKEAMNNEIRSMRQRSLDIIDSVEQHKNIVKGCDDILKSLNPEIAEKQRQEEELRNEINELKKMFKDFIACQQQQK